jgi:hypothetical protein
MGESVCHDLHHQHLVVPNASKYAFLFGMPIDVLFLEMKNLRKSFRQKERTPTTDEWPLKIFVGSID